ncbi:hypothetical protein MPDQ_004154 [Monascus purpureus]|uniref:Uncharacterized protein n=1 Tax=Monascus purpureus TaxID=5098 RepID=A0A507QJQ1_MONPU|nr:hypothetical protein MPDQ_004154 [Monascus purpureus]
MSQGYRKVVAVVIVIVPGRAGRSLDASGEAPRWSRRWARRHLDFRTMAEQDTGIQTRPGTRKEPRGLVIAEPEQAGFLATLPVTAMSSWSLAAMEKTTAGQLMMPDEASASARLSGGVHTAFPRFVLTGLWSSQSRRGDGHSLIRFQRDRQDRSAEPQSWNFKRPRILCRGAAPIGLCVR